MSGASETVKAWSRDLVRVYMRLPLRGKSRVRNAFDRLLAPEGGVEYRRVGPCVVPLSHEHEATRNMAYGTYENREIDCVRQIISDGDVVVDVGANVGFLAAVFAQAVGPSGRVHAFEPAPTAFDVLSQTCASNAYENMCIYPLAVSDRDGRGVFFETENILARGYGRLDRRPSARFAAVKEQSVDTISLDRFFRERAEELERMTLVKVDVEGHEEQVVRGMQGIFDCGHRPAIMTEATASGEQWESLRAYGQLLGGYAYQPYLCEDLRQPVSIESLPEGYHQNLIWRVECR